MITCVGDSNGWGWDPAGGRHPAALRWPDRLAQALDLPLQNLSQPGRTLLFEDPVRGLISARDTWQAALAARPHYLVLALGINDLAAGGDTAAIAQALAHYLNAWQTAGQPGHLLLLAPAPLPALQDPWRRLFGPSAAESAALLPLWQAAASRWQLDCLDPAPLLAGSADGLHWTAQDHAAIAEALAARLGAQVGPSARPG